jgi:hypothetical protein
MCHQPRKPTRRDSFMFRLLALAALSVGLHAATAQAQEAFLANNVITAQDASLFRQQIHDFVTVDVAKLKSDDPAIQKMAKDDLISKVEQQANGQPLATASFLNEYADELNQQLVPLAKNKSLRVKLNAAVVNASVAAQANNARQADATLAFIKDSEEPIVLWGLKAANYEVPALLQIPAGVRNDKISPAILPVVKAHSSGPIIEEAYKALTLDATNGLTNITAQQLQDAAGPVLDLFAYRVGLYAKGAPEDPLAENIAALFLIRGKVWVAEVAKQQRQTMDTMYKLCDATANLELAGDPQKSDLVSLLRQTGKAFYILGVDLNDKDVMSAGTAVSVINENTGSTEVQAAIQSLQAAVTNVNLSNSTAASGGGAPPP